MEEITREEAMSGFHAIGRGMSRENPVLPLVKELFETNDPAEMAERLSSGKWVVLQAAAYMDGSGRYLYAMGRTL